MSVSSALASALRAGSGAVANNPREALPQASELLLYEFEGCPFCRKVREFLTILDLAVTVYPCPKRGERFRPEVVRQGGKAQFPYLVDLRADQAQYESDAIIAHLAERYGDGSVPWALRLGPLTSITASAAGLVRGGAGTFARPSRRPEELLVLYGFEACRQTRPVRETLCVLEIAYELRNVGRGSRRRKELKGLGADAPPLLEDPNTGDVRIGAPAIVSYLRERYAVG